MKLKTLALIAASSVMSMSAIAQTEYNLTVTNTAKLTYTSGTDAREAISDPVTFKVDRKVIFSFTEVDPGSNAQIVAPGDTTYSEYTLTNFSNAPIDYKITPESGTAPFTISYLIEDGTTTGPDANDTEITNAIALAAYNGTDAVTQTIYVKIVTAATATDGNSQLYTLTATAVEPTGTPIVGATAGDDIVADAASDPWIEGKVQTIADETLGTIRTETGTYTVGAAIIALVKSVAILSDPISGIASATVFPKAIPGAIVQYTLAVKNTGHAPATVELTDLLSKMFDKVDTVTSVLVGGIAPTGLVTLANDATTTENDSLLTIPDVSVIAVPANNAPPEQTTLVTFEVVLK
jgi:uncharacterized repeat protein (TIGR01451 family)